jgi:predicted nucleic acid-binding protein
VRRILIDTSVYVDWFRARRHEKIVAGHRGPPALSAVVAMELIAGERRRERMQAWVANFIRSGRLLIPGWQVWRLAGRVLRALSAAGLDARSLTNDVLIAMTARVAGLALITTNRIDFERIAAIEPYDLEVVR